MFKWASDRSVVFQELRIFIWFSITDNRKPSKTVLASRACVSRANASPSPVVRKPCQSRWPSLARGGVVLRSGSGSFQGEECPTVGFWPQGSFAPLKHCTRKIETPHVSWHNLSCRV